MSKPQALVRYRQQTAPVGCPYGEVQRLITGGDGGVANVHVVRVTEGSPHYHADYDEVYYVLAGQGTLWAGDETSRLEPGAAVVIPRGVEHSLRADEGETLEFVIFGTPAMSIDDERAKPRKP